MFTLQLLHASDLEGGLDAVENAPRFAAIVDALEDEYENTIILSAGDNYIPGPFFNAAADSAVEEALNSVYSDLFGVDLTNLTAGAGRIDIAIMNAIGFDASALGNHEFDVGSAQIAEIIVAALDDNTVVGEFGVSPADIENIGALFPYLSANLDFSADSALSGLFTDELLTSDAFAATPDDLLAGARPPKLAAATIIELPQPDETIERVGVVGATTQILGTISSPSGTVDATGGTNDMAALAAALQPQIDALIAEGVNKIITISHLQDIALEQELAGLLRGVDVMVAGGSDTRLADDGDVLRPGDEADGAYPLATVDADGNPVLIVSTDGEYSYVGRLVVDFDDAGVLLPESVDPTESGAFATIDSVVEAVADGADLFAEGTKGAAVATLVASVTGVIEEKDGEVFGVSDVYLEGRREAVRTEETNLGNLTADANLAAARIADPTVRVSLKNGGGIRAPIGEIVDNGDGTFTLAPPPGNESISKPEGGVSLLDLENALRFNNRLALVTLSTDDLKIILEHGVAASGDGATPGRFPQVGGIQFSFDPARQAQVLDSDGGVTTPGERIRNAVLLGEDGRPDTALIVDGVVVDGAPEAIRVVTLNFLAAGGDGYPYPQLGEDIAFLTEGGGLTMDADAADLLGEQAALADFLAATFSSADTAFAANETPAGVDARIQNLAERGDALGGPIATSALTPAKLVEFQGETGDPDDREGGSEVVAHLDGKLYTTNGASDRIDVWDIASEAADGSIDLGGIAGYAGVQSVAAKNGLVAAAIDIAPGDGGAPSNGVVAIFDAATRAQLAVVEVGVLPDMLTFTEDGSRILVANEGEFNTETDLTANAPGSVSVIDVADPSDPTVETIELNADTLADVLAGAGNPRPAPGQDALLDLEPEYIAIAPDGSKAFITLQEANHVAVLDLASLTFVDLIDLGVVDHAVEGFGADFLDDEVIDIRTAPVVGLRMPDAIAAFAADGMTYFVTANEGDGRGDAPEGDEARVGDILDGEIDGLSIDASVDTSGLERLVVSTVDGDVDGDGDIDVLHAFGSRSFTIFSETGEVVFDSGDDFERIVAQIAPERFLDDDGELGQNRADAKGVEPEAITVGEVGGRIYAVIGLERDSGLMVYDVTTPAEASFVTYVDGFANGDISPETIAFIDASESVSGFAQIAVAYEISGETVLFDLRTEAQTTSASNEGDRIDGGEADDVLKGQGGDDTLSGGGGDDLVFGHSGDDELSGGDGEDRLKAGDGDDSVDGGAGDDRILGGDGNDTILGGDGDDVIVTGRGDDSVDGGAGADVVLGFRGAERIAGGAGDDTLRGGLDDDTLVGGAGDDRLLGGPGRDSFLFDERGFGQDRIIDFRLGSDVIDFRGSELTLLDLDIFVRGGSTVISVSGTDDSIVVASVDLVGREDDVLIF